MNVSNLIAVQGAAERLAGLAAKAVQSFLVVDAELSKPEGTGFAWFLRDSLPSGAPLTVSTGAVGVVADIVELSQYASFLRSLSCKTEIGALMSAGVAAESFLANTANTVPLPSAFGLMNAYSTALYAAGLARQSQSARSSLFLRKLVLDWRRGWPQLAQVERAHPFVAHSVIRAIHLWHADAMSIAKSCDKFHFKDAGVLTDGEPGAHDWWQLNVNDLTSALEIDATMSGSFAERYESQAKEYLWEQIGYLRGERNIRERFQLYDPAGACFALAVLIRAGLLQPNSSLSAIVGKHGDLITETIRHIVQNTSAVGTLPFGMPFAYSEKGMGAFTTSVAAICALAWSVLSLFETSRHNNYPNRDYLRRMLSALSEPMTELLRLTAAFEGSLQRVEIKNEEMSLLKVGREMIGWSTDRAPHSKRIESWVTVEVLRYAIYARLLAQEIAQFLVVEKYDGAPSDSDAVWPYTLSGLLNDDPAPQPMLVDPDEGDAFDSCPLKYLHASFCGLMDRTVDGGWSSDVSSVLLFGPPGTSKTTLVKSLAKQLGWPLIELTPSHFVIDGVQSIEVQAKEIFQNLSVLRETVVLFDELDSLLVDRDRIGPDSILSFSVPAMLPKLQSLAKSAKRQRVLLVFATNFYDRLDPAMVRRGRIDKHLLVLPYNQASRERVIRNTGNLKGADIVDAAQRTALCVYEELREYTKALARGAAVAPVPSVTPTLYASRIPNVENSEPSLNRRAALRLAIEIAEVANRHLGNPRALNVEARLPEVIGRLDRLIGDLNAPQDADWKMLCKRTRVELER